MKYVKYIVFPILAIAAFYLFFADITEKRYNRIMCYYIARRLTENTDTFEGRVTAMRDFVHENTLSINGYHNRLDTVAIEKLTYGIGWCDQQCRVFMQLARAKGITTRLLFLLLKSGSSPHSIAEALAPDGRWMIVDSAYKLDLIKPDGSFATQADIKEDLSIVADNQRVKLRAQFEERWADPEYLFVYYNLPRYVIVKEGVNFDFLKYIPLSLIKPIVEVISDRYIKKNIIPAAKNKYEADLIKARTQDLLGNYEKSKRAYESIIENCEELLLIRKAQYYKALLLKDRNKLEEAYSYITGILEEGQDNPYYKYLLGLRARILQAMGRNEESERDLLENKYNPEA